MDFLVFRLETKGLGLGALNWCSSKAAGGDFEVLA